MTKYNAFHRLIYPQVKEDNPDAAFGELTSKVAEAYKEISDEQESQVNKMVKEDKKRYEKQLKEAQTSPVADNSKSKSKSQTPTKEEKPQQVMPK